MGSPYRVGPGDGKRRAVLGENLELMDQTPLRPRSKSLSEGEAVARYPLVWIGSSRSANQGRQTRQYCPCLLRPGING